MEQEYFMQQALALAQEAAVHGEVPVGCVIVRNGEIVGRGRNQREEKQAAVSHAEMEAIAQANAALGSWRLDECDLYVTLEPCPMCAGAILNARIRRVYYGARDEVMGACGGVLNLFMEGFPRPPQLVGNVCGDECRDVLQTFSGKFGRKTPRIRIVRQTLLKISQNFNICNRIFSHLRDILIMQETKTFFIFSSCHICGAPSGTPLYGVRRYLPAQAGFLLPYGAFLFAGLML